MALLVYERENCSGQPSKDQKQGGGEVIFYCHLYLATCRLEVLVPNNIDIDCMAEHFTQFLNTAQGFCVDEERCW